MKSIPAIISLALIAGCGSTPQQQNKNFYTSGSQEADQRAEQRMAQSQELKGDTGAANTSAQNPDAKSLYQRLGGDPGLQAIADDFITRAMADPRVNWDRQGITKGGLSIHREQSETWKPTPENIAALKLHLAQFLALATGGPSKYEGKEMKQAHANLHITNDEFDASVGDLKATLDKLQIANTEQKELLAIVETTRPQVVEEE